MIDVNNITKPNFDFRGFACNGYRQDSPEIGLKTWGYSWGDSYTSLLELRSSEDWLFAQREFWAHKKAADIGIAPQVYSLTSCCNSAGKFVPCITMEHVNNVTTLEDAYCIHGLIDRETAFDILLDLQKAYAIIELIHADAHGGNVLLYFDEEKKIYFSRSVC